MPSEIIDFYLNDKLNTEGYSYSDIMSFNKERMEYDHAYIQWLFPLQEPSSFYDNAPLLTDEDIKYFNGSYLLKSRLGDAFDRFLWFLGLSYRSKNIIITPNFYELDDLTKPNHNWFRITRVLKSCNVLGVKERPYYFFKFLSLLNSMNNGIIGWDKAFEYWENAVKDIEIK